MAIDSAPKQIACVSAVPYLIASLVGAVVYTAGIVLAADGFMSNLWNHLRLVPPTSCIVFSTHCAMGRRPRRRWTILCAMLSALAWAVATEASAVEMMGVPWGEVMVRLPMTVLSYAVLSYLVVVSTVVIRSFFGPDKIRLSLRAAFAILTSAGVMLALIAKSRYADNIAFVLLYFHIPYLALYGFSAWSAFRSTAPALTALLTLSGSLGLGWAMDQFITGPTDWYWILSPGVYTATLLGALFSLRIADRLTLNRHASGRDAPATADAIASNEN